MLKDPVKQRRAVRLQPGLISKHWGVLQTDECVQLDTEGLSLMQRGQQWVALSQPLCINSLGVWSLAGTRHWARFIKLSLYRTVHFQGVAIPWCQLECSREDHQAPTASTHRCRCTWSPAESRWCCTGWGRTKGEMASMFHILNKRRVVFAGMVLPLQDFQAPSQHHPMRWREKIRQDWKETFETYGYIIYPYW